MINHVSSNSKAAIPNSLLCMQIRGHMIHLESHPLSENEFFDPPKNDDSRNDDASQFEDGNTIATCCHAR